MSYIDEPKQTPPIAPPQVIRRSSPVVVVLLTVLVIAVVALAAVMALPYLGVQLKLPGAQQQAKTKEQILAELDPQSLVVPGGRQLSLVEFGQRVFEVTRISFDPNRNFSMVYITVPGTPPQQGVYRIGDSFDRGRISVRDILAQGVILACDGDQREFKVLGAAAGDATTVSNPSGFNFMPPKDLSSGGVIPEPLEGATGRIKAPANPRVEPETPVSTEPEAEGPKSLKDFPDERYITMPRAEYKAFTEDLPKQFNEGMLWQAAIDPENPTPYGVEIKKVQPDTPFQRWGLKPGDVILQINETEIRRHKDLIEALHVNSFRDGMTIHVMRENLLVSFIISPSDAK